MRNTQNARPAGGTVVRRRQVIAIMTAVLLSATAAQGQVANPATGSPEAALIEKGQYLARAGDCISCHTRPDGKEFSGGLPLTTPFGTIFTANITPDAETGIGNWTEEQLARAMRAGVAADGSHLYPGFPYTAYTKVTDEDVHAIYAYLKSLPPVRYKPPKNQMPFPFNQRFLLTFWNKLFLKEGRYTPDPAQSAEWNRGAYLVEGLGHCGACHTPRNMLGGERNSLALTGGVYQDSVLDAVHEQDIVQEDDDIVRPWSTANLTPSPRGLGDWSLEQLSAYLKTGHNERAGAFGPMAEVVANSTKYLTDDDTKAMALYLKSLAPLAQKISRKPSQAQMDRGEIVYTVHCGDCHQPTGLGTPKTPDADPTKVSPPLVSNTVVQAPNAETFLNVILYGVHETILDAQAWPKMPGFELDFGLDDQQIADLATYVRNSWGNQAEAVDPKTVAKQR